MRTIHIRTEIPGPKSRALMARREAAGGIGCLNMGHRAPRVVAAIREQLDKFLHPASASRPTKATSHLPKN